MSLKVRAEGKVTIFGPSTDSGRHMGETMSERVHEQVCGSLA